MIKNDSFPSKEYELINAISQTLKFSNKSSFKLGIGDDAALRICENKEQLIFTADILVENVHFSLDYMTLEEVGYKAMVANISDCAAMASRPDSAMIQLVFPKKETELKKAVIKLYQGINRASVEYDFPVIGGDISSGDHWIIGVNMTGKKKKHERLLFRKGAKIGDSLWVTGILGESSAGLEVLRNYGRTQKYQNFINKHISPKARVAQALKLADDESVSTLTDISDGIGKECRTLAFENDVSVEINIPDSLILEDMTMLGEELGISPVNWIMSGGEDYELLFTADSNFD